MSERQPIQDPQSVAEQAHQLARIAEFVDPTDPQSLEDHNRLQAHLEVMDQRNDTDQLINSDQYLQTQDNPYEEYSLEALARAWAHAEADNDQTIVEDVTDAIMERIDQHVAKAEEASSNREEALLDRANTDFHGQWLDRVVKLKDGFKDDEGGTKDSESDSEPIDLDEDSFYEEHHQEWDEKEGADKSELSTSEAQMNQMLGLERNIAIDTLLNNVEAVKESTAESDKLFSEYVADNDIEEAEMHDLARMLRKHRDDTIDMLLVRVDAGEDIFTEEELPHVQEYKQNLLEKIDLEIYELSLEQYAQNKEEGSSSIDAHHAINGLLKRYAKIQGMDKDNLEAYKKSVRDKISAAVSQSKESDEAEPSKELVPVTQPEPLRDGKQGVFKRMREWFNKGDKEQTGAKKGIAVLGVLGAGVLGLMLLAGGNSGDNDKEALPPTPIEQPSDEGEDQTSSTETSEVGESSDSNSADTKTDDAETQEESPVIGELEIKGDTIWSDAEQNLIKNGTENPSDKQILDETNRILELNNLTYEEARKLPVGYSFKV